MMRDAKYRSKVWSWDGYWCVRIEYTCNGHGVWYPCVLEERRHRVMEDELFYELRFFSEREAQTAAARLLREMVESQRRCDAPKVAQQNAKIVEVVV